MKNLKLLPLVMCGILVVGCMSLEERLASNDPRVKQEAELELLDNARKNGTEADYIAAIRRVTDKDILEVLSVSARGSRLVYGQAALENLNDEESLVRVCCRAPAPDIAKKALEKIKSEQSFAKIVLQVHNEALALSALAKIQTDVSREQIALRGRSTVVRRTALRGIQDVEKKKSLESKVNAEIRAAELKSSKDALQKLERRLVARNRRGDYKVIAPAEARSLVDGVTAHEDLPALIEAIRSAETEKGTRRNLAEAFMASKGNEDVYALWKAFNMSDVLEGMLRGAVLTNALQFTEKETIVDFLTVARGGSLVFQDAKIRIPLLKKLPDPDIADVISHDYLELRWDDWNAGRFLPIEETFQVLPQIKDIKISAKLLSLIFKEIRSFKEMCRNSYSMCWNGGDDKKVSDIVKSIPKLDDSVVKELFATDEESFMYLTGRVSESVAYEIIASGTAKNQETEGALVARLSPQKCDMKVHNGAKYASTKSAILKRMPAELKKEVAAAVEKAYAGICAKARAAEKETFALDGFYLGMSFDDAKIVLQRTFPKLETEEDIDGTGSNADHVIYIDGQESPFCYADVSDKKVYQFNFGKKLLKKWYQYDVQTPREWATAYGRTTKADMRFKLITRDTTVYENDLSCSYKVWFRQESYQYKHNSKEYRLTYFGEEKNVTAEGGLGGALIKEKAARDFRYIRGDQGSLRVKIERD